MKSMSINDKAIMKKAKEINSKIKYKTVTKQVHGLTINVKVYPKQVVERPNYAFPSATNDLSDNIRG